MKTMMLFSAIDISGITPIVAIVIYCALAAIAIWGGYCVAMAWTRVSRQRFATEADQHEFLNQLEKPLFDGKFDSAASLCQDDIRAVPQLALLAINNRNAGYAQVKQLVADRFQRDVLSDLEYRVNWVNTVINTAPMVGLLGTVIGMMGAFGSLYSSDGPVAPTVLAGDIMTALITTACGLAIAIPLRFFTQTINIRISKLEDLVSVGMSRFLDMFRAGLINSNK